MDVDAQADAGHEADLRARVSDVDAEIEDGVEPEAGAGRGRRVHLTGDREQYLDALSIGEKFYVLVLWRVSHLGLAQRAPDFVEQCVDLDLQESDRVVLIGIEEVDGRLDLVGDVVEDHRRRIELSRHVSAHDGHLSGQCGDLHRTSSDETRGLDRTVGEGSQVRLERGEVAGQPYGVEVVRRVRHDAGDLARDVDGAFDRGGGGGHGDGQLLLHDDISGGGDGHGIPAVGESRQWDRRRIGARRRRMRCGGGESAVRQVVITDGDGARNGRFGGADSDAALGVTIE